MLNIDSAFAAFMSERQLVEVLAEMCNARDLSRVDAHRLRASARSLSGFKVWEVLRHGRWRSGCAFDIESMGCATEAVDVQVQVILPLLVQVSLNFLHRPDVSTVIPVYPQVAYPIKGGFLRRKALIGLSESGADRTMFYNDKDKK